MTDIVERLRERIIADAFERHAIEDIFLAERLTKERIDAANEIERLRGYLEEIGKGYLDADGLREIAWKAADLTTPPKSP